eukprot:TRINITY_DN10454_c0_g1_i1.p1 TRINITY_DN10454_c0_g1~~TRINITY_DN10454_c0_g1_i1.p1  ORF type:complete len:113 (-),score=20.49 TRINITY_DN10454_c0_g1_i1:186-503(-)
MNSISSTRCASIIKLAQEVFRKHPEIVSAHLFGSFSKGTDHENSDVDLLIDVDPNSNFHIMDQIRLQMELEEQLHRPVDLVDHDSIQSDWAKKSILFAPTNIRII